MGSTSFQHNLFHDKCFTKLEFKIAGRLNDPAEDAKALAAGYLLLAYTLAQEEAGEDNPRGLISAEKWERRGIPNEIVEAGLAVREGEFIYLRGAEKHCKFKVDRAVAGRAGGLAKARNAKQNLAAASRSKQTYPLSLSLALPIKKEEEAPAPVFEKVKAEIPNFIMTAWHCAYTEKSVDECLRRGFNHYVARKDKRPLIECLVAWVDREDRFLVEKPKSVGRNFSPGAYVDPGPAPTREEIERAKAQLRCMGLNLNNVPL